MVSLNKLRRRVMLSVVCLVAILCARNLVMSGVGRRAGSWSNHHYLFGIGHVIAVHGMAMVVSMLVMIKTPVAFIETFAFWVCPVLFHQHWFFDRWKRWRTEAGLIWNWTMAQWRLRCCHWYVAVVSTHWQRLFLTWDFLAQFRQLLFHFSLSLMYKYVNEIWK